MPRFHFNVRDGRNWIDHESIELGSIDVAKKEAVKLSGDLLREHSEMFWKSADWKMEITDVRGQILFKLTFVATEVATGLPS